MQACYVGRLDAAEVTGSSCCTLLVGHSRRGIALCRCMMLPVAAPHLALAPEGHQGWYGLSTGPLDVKVWLAVGSSTSTMHVLGVATD